MVAIPRFVDHRGSLCVIEDTCLLPFEAKRFYYIFDVRPDARRGCHAHKSQQQLIFAIAGAFQILLDDGRARREVCLGGTNEGLYVPPLIWHELHSFSPGSICGVLASGHYDPLDAVSCYEDFLGMVR